MNADRNLLGTSNVIASLSRTGSLSRLPLNDTEAFRIANKLAQRAQPIHEGLFRRQHRPGERLDVLSRRMDLGQRRAVTNSAGGAKLDTVVAGERRRCAVESLGRRTRQATYDRAQHWFLYLFRRL